MTVREGLTEDQAQARGRRRDRRAANPRADVIGDRHDAAMRIPCDRCDGDGHDPDGDRACDRCEGRGYVEGRPADWPAPGAIVGEVGSFMRFEILDGDSFGMIRARKMSGEEEIVALRPEDLGSRLDVLE